MTYSSNAIDRPNNAIIPTTPEPPPLSSSEPTSPSSSVSSPNVRNEGSPARHMSPEWTGGGMDSTLSQTPSRDNSTQNTPRNTPTQQQQQNRNQNQHNVRNTTSALSLRDRRIIRGNDEQNGNQNANGRVERGLNSGGQIRRPNRSNRNRNSVMSSNDRRTDPPQPPDLPRGYGIIKLFLNVT